MFLFLFTALLFQFGTAADVGDTDSLLDMDELEFEEFFGLDHVTDPEEFEKKQKALKANEEEIRKINKEFAEGKKANSGAKTIFLGRGATSINGSVCPAVRLSGCPSRLKS